MVAKVSVRVKRPFVPEDGKVDSVVALDRDCRNVDDGFKEELEEHGDEAQPCCGHARVESVKSITEVDDEAVRAKGEVAVSRAWGGA